MPQARLQRRPLDEDNIFVEDAAPLSLAATVKAAIERKNRALSEKEKFCCLMATD